MSSSYPTGILKSSSRKTRVPAKSSVARRLSIADKIQRLGKCMMVACTNCRNNNEVCIMMEGSKWCACCAKKNMSCDGNFSEEEFDQLAEQKRKIHLQAEALRRKRTELLAELVKVQQDLETQERLRDRINEDQRQMVIREMAALEALGEFDAGEDAPSAFGVQHGGELYAVDELQLFDFLSHGSSRGFDGGTSQQTPQVCVPLVPMCFLSHRILTI